MSTFNTSRTACGSPPRPRSPSTTRPRPRDRSGAVGPGGEDPVAAQANRFVERVSNRVKHNGEAASPTGRARCPRTRHRHRGRCGRRGIICTRPRSSSRRTPPRHSGSGPAIWKPPSRTAPAIRRRGECILEFLAHAAIEGQKSIPYRSWSSLTTSSSTAC